MMLKLGRKRKLQAIVVALFVVVAAYAKVTGPDAGYTNAPGDFGNCTACHNDPVEEPDKGPGSVRINGVPATYQPGQQYTLTVTVQQTNRVRYGFQLTVIDRTGSRAGTLASLGPETQVNVITGPGGRQYIEHTQLGTNPTGVGVGSWQIRWTAPSTDIGTVTFYVAGNAADGNLSTFGDYIYTNLVTSDSPESKVSVALVSDPTGLTLGAGSTYTITWTGTGGSNVAGYEARYSTDDGATFPITNLIAATTDNTVRSFDWTVPNKPTSQARIRIEASSALGTAVNSISGRFTISGDGAVQPPHISGASVIGKALWVSGTNFEIGAQLFMDGAKQKKTFNDDANPTTMLFAKKSGKNVSRGQTVVLQVKNPDGTVSNEFSFTRPTE